jgi:hypothetical protein
VVPRGGIFLGKWRSSFAGSFMSSQPALWTPGISHLATTASLHFLSALPNYITVQYSTVQYSMMDMCGRNMPSVYMKAWTQRSFDQQICKDALKAVLQIYTYTHTKWSTHAAVLKHSIKS